MGTFILKRKTFGLHTDTNNVIELDNEIKLIKSEPGKFIKFLGKLIKPYGRAQEKSLFYDIKFNDKIIGTIELNDNENGEINVVWIDVNNDYRGQKIATRVLTTIIEYAKSLGFKTMTLEVPGNSKDARHIYDKLGFKETGVAYGEEGDIWDGLTCMKLDL